MNRTRGRPRLGTFLIEAEVLEALPVNGTAAFFARALGVSSQTMRTWIVSLNAPAQRVKGRWIVERQQMIDWLRITGRTQ